MIEELKKNLLQGKFEEAERICEDLSENKVCDILMSVAYDTENICVYSFVIYLAKKCKKICWIELAFNIMIHPFSFMEGAYSVALFHARELLLEERNIKNLERILFFNNIPEKLLDEEEARKIAKEILDLDPNNKVANVKFKNTKNFICG